MAFFRGQDGRVALGGVVAGTPRVSGAVAAGVGTLTLWGNGLPLSGVLAAGDQLTIAGEAGGPLHTITGGPGGAPFILASGDTFASVGITPAIAAGGVPANAVVTLLATSIAQTVEWALTTSLEELDTTVQGDKWKTVMGGEAFWAGRLSMRLDLTDTRQRQLVDAILAGVTDAGKVAALTFVVERTAAGTKQFIGAALLRQLGITSQRGQLVTASCDFTGSGRLVPSWS